MIQNKHFLSLVVFVVVIGCSFAQGGEVWAASLKPLLSSRPSFLGSLRESIRAMREGDLVRWKQALDRAEAYKDLFVNESPMGWFSDREIWLRLVRYHYHRAKVDCPDPTKPHEPSKQQLRQMYKKAESCLKEFQQAVSYFQRYFRGLCGHRCLAEGKKRDLYTQQGVLRMEALQFQLYLLRDYERFLFKTLWFRPISIWRTTAWKKKVETWRSMLTYAGILSPWVKRKQLRKQKADLLASTLRTFQRRTLGLRKSHGPVMQMATIGLLFTLSGAMGLLIYVSILELQQANFQSPYAEAGLAVIASVTTAGMILGVIALFALPDPQLFRELQHTHALYLSGNPPLPSRLQRVGRVFGDPPLSLGLRRVGRVSPVHLLPKVSTQNATIPIPVRAEILWRAW